MKRTTLFFTCIHFLLGITLAAQEFSPNGSVSSEIRYEEYPVDLYTGTPQVGVPIYSLPTRSDNVGVSVSLNYHPSAISSYNRAVGDLGRGWNLSFGGAIARNILGMPDELAWGSNNYDESDLYYFNFMGHAGKFKLNKYPTQVIATVTENSGPLVKINVEYNTTSNAITAFKFYDDKGYIYRFAAVDEFIFINSSSVHIPCNYSFQMSEIIDNNNNILASFSYNTHTKVEPYHHAGENNKYSIINEIVSPGFGRLEILKTFTYNDNWFLVTGVVVRDFLGTPIRKFEFLYDDLSAAESRLVQVSESDFSETEIQSYKFFYKFIGRHHHLAYDQLGKDAWGYTNIVPKWCSSIDITTPSTSSVGVLEKMILPTGGCVIYNYESNTYSYEAGRALDQGYNSTNPNPNFYSDISNPKNDHNRITTALAEKAFSSSNSAALTFTLSETTDVYFGFTGQPFYTGIEDESSPMPGYSYPGFRLRNSVGTLIGSYSLSDNSDNGCLGPKKTLQPGTYSISMTNTSQTTGSAIVRSFSVSPNVKKWWNGGGIRIKTIGYFNDSNVVQTHYTSGSTAIPSKEINYNYNLFSAPEYSSGSLGNDAGMGNDVVRYKNVTVYESGNVGRTEYTFSNSIDYPEDYISTDFRTGNLINKKIYDQGGVLQLETIYNYDIQSSIVQNVHPRSLNITMGWVVPTEVVNKEYFSSGVLETKNTFLYNSNRQIIEKKVFTSRSSETYTTKYIYHNANSVYSTNRINEIESIENYRDTELLSKKKIVYSNIWADTQNNPINVSFLPQQMQSAKQNNVLETSFTVNLYDQYGHPLEVTEENGRKKVYVYGYNSSLVIAEIENIAYANIPASLITAAQSASNNNDETALRTALLNLRNAPELTGAFVTTYTHKPLVGMVCKDDVIGYRTIYEYDAANRLKAVKDKDGNILTENQYHVKTN